MIRTLFAVAAFATLSTAALAQAPATPGGVTVTPPSRDQYVIRLDVAGKGAREMRLMIWRASNDACDRVGWTSGMSPSYIPLCVSNANDDGLRQMDRILDQRRRGLQPTQLAFSANFAAG